MFAVIYDQNTGISLFERKMPKSEQPRFEQYLTEQGFVYEPQFDSWTNDERGHAAVIYPYE